MLLEYLGLIIENDQKVIIFSQYLGQGIKKLQKILESKEIKFSIYTGEQSDRQKEKAIVDFRNNSDVHVFLATIDSGGSGLTLTEASYLIHFDHHWNPAKRRQAEDRAHRIGQKNNLNVYSFWMEGTIEENIRKKLHEKQKLANILIDSLAEGDIENLISTEDWLNIFGINVSQSQVKSKRKASKQSRIVTKNLEEVLVDFAIITAIDVERKAICEMFNLTEKHRIFKESRVYWRGQLGLNNNSEFYEVIVAQSPDMANVDAALLATDTIHHWRPGAILMVGLAGAATEEQKLGDIIIGDAVYYYERGKETPNGLIPEPVQYPVDQTLWSRVISLPEWVSDISLSRPDGRNTPPKVHKGIIASGERVIADALVRDTIASASRKIVAIEMEGYGVSKAAWQSFDRVRHLIIRSICDYADSSKNSEWHSYAAAIAAGYTRYFLLDRPLEPRN